MEFCISLNRLHFFAYHGLLEHEKIFGNDFIVDVSVYIACDKEMEDEIGHTVSYADLFSVVDAVMAQPHGLLESLALKISKQLSLKYPAIKRGTVRIEKVRPPIPGMKGSASVSLDFTAKDFLKKH